MPAIDLNQILKYRLQALFVARFGVAYATAKKQFGEANALSYRTVQRDCLIRITQAKTIPVERLSQYAKYFNLDITDLRTKKEQV